MSKPRIYRRRIGRLSPPPGYALPAIEQDSGASIEIVYVEPRWRPPAFYIAFVLAFVGVTLLALAALGCTEVTRTTAVPEPPTFEELEGDYVADWRPTSGGVPTSALANITAATIAFEHLPCWTLEGQESIGGEFEYDLAGHLHAELKTLGGSTKLTIDGGFSRDGSFDGGYEVRFLDNLCEGGVLELRRVPQ